jgi:hypothetical protein
LCSQLPRFTICVFHEAKELGNCLTLSWRLALMHVLQKQRLHSHPVVSLPAASDQVVPLGEDSQSLAGEASISPGKKTPMIKCDCGCHHRHKPNLRLRKKKGLCCWSRMNPMNRIESSPKGRRFKEMRNPGKRDPNDSFPRFESHLSP